MKHKQKSDNKDKNRSNEIENRKTTNKTNENKCWLFKKTSITNTL